MAITAYVGLPGSGKSYSVVEYVILPALNSGRVIATNMPLNYDEVFAVYPDARGRVYPLQSDTPEGWSLLWNKIPKGALVVLDEIWQFWPAGLKADSMNSACKAFLAEHRHCVGEGRSTEIVIIIQDLSNAAQYVRNLVDKTYLSVKLDMVGATKKFRVDIYQGSVKGPRYPKSGILRTLYGSYKPQVYRYYLSHTKSETGAAGDETRADGRANIFKGYAFLLGVPAALAVVVFAFLGVYRYFNPPGVSAPVVVSPLLAPVVASAPPAAPVAPVVPVVPPRLVQPPDSLRWRLVGYVRTPTSSIAYIEYGGRTVRIDGRACDNLELEPRCLFRGEYVARYTGEDSRRPAAAPSFSEIPAAGVAGALGHVAADSR